MLRLWVNCVVARLIHGSNALRADEPHAPSQSAQSVKDALTENPGAVCPLDSKPRALLRTIVSPMRKVRAIWVWPWIQTGTCPRPLSARRGWMHNGSGYLSCSRVGENLAGSIIDDCKAVLAEHIGPFGPDTGLTILALVAILEGPRPREFRRALKASLETWLRFEAVF